MEPSDPVPLPVSVPGLKPPLARELNEVEDPEIQMFFHKVKHSPSFNDWLHTDKSVLVSAKIPYI